MCIEFCIFTEQRDGALQKVTLELIGKARELLRDRQGSLTALLLCEKAGDMPRILCEYGADRVIVAENPRLREYSTEPYAKTLSAMIRAYAPDILLYGATSIGRDLAPRVSARIRTGLTADCTSLAIDPETGLLLMTRPAFGGNIMATIVCADHKPQMATVRPGVMTAMQRDPARKCVAEHFDAQLTDTDITTRIISVEKRAPVHADITQAKRLVSGGRGMGSPNGFTLLHELAEALGDAEVASSRACVDAGWTSPEQQVGQTGKTVRPALYIACGISGAVQHLAGMEDSEYIIAINNDSTAAIFEAADLGIVGDVHAVIPKLIEAIKAYNVQ